MNVYVDEQALPADMPTFAAALRAAAEAAERRGRIVVETTLDGQPVPDELLRNPPQEPVGTDLRCVTAEPWSLVRVTLMEASDALESARALQAASAEMVQAGRVAEALRPLSEAVATWQVVRDAVEQSAAFMGMPLEPAGAPAAEGGGADAALAGELIASLTKNLNEIRRSLAGEDWSSLADVLAYDMGDEIDRWKVLLAKMADRAGRGG